MLKNGLYFFAMLLFSFTALQAVEKCPESKETLLDRSKNFYSLNYLTNEEASAFYALLEDDNEELSDLAAKHFFSFNQNENNPKGAKKNSIVVCSGDEEEVLTLLPST